MKLIWIETEELEREESVANLGQCMVTTEDGTDKYISVIRNNDESDTWAYGVSNISVIPLSDDEIADKEAWGETVEQLMYYAQFENLEEARASEYGIYFLLNYLLVMAETEGLDENNDELIDNIIDFIKNSPDETMIKLLKSAENSSYVAFMKAAVKMNNIPYVNKYIREFKVDDRGASRIMDFDPSPEIVKIIEEYGGVGEITDLDYKEIRDKIREFNRARDWEKFHTPANLAKSISIEAGELLECFQWTDQCDRHSVADELADVMMYCIMMADRMNLDMKHEMLRKMAENGAKYPVKKAKGNSAKYNKL